MARVTRERVMQFCIVRNRTVDMQFQKKLNLNFLLLFKEADGDTCHPRARRGGLNGPQ